jgi:hypothetical protein
MLLHDVYDDVVAAPHALEPASVLVPHEPVAVV